MRNLLSKKRREKSKFQDIESNDPDLIPRCTLFQRDFAHFTIYTGDETYDSVTSKKHSPLSGSDSAIS
jgi:hypothetical protein